MTASDTRLDTAYETGLDTALITGLADAPAPGRHDRAAPSPASETARRGTNESAPRSLTSDLLASGGLMLFSLAVAAGFARVFAGWEFFDNLAVLAVVGHGIGLGCRRVGAPAWLFIPLVTLALFWTVGVMFYAATFSWGMPSGDTWTLFSSELDLVREQFRVAVAPVLDGGGWDVLAAIGMAFAVALADAFAFGALARAEALVPGGVLFIFIAALGADRLRVELSVALVAAGVIATVLLRAHHAPGGIGAVRGRPALRVTSRAVGVAVVVACLAGFVGQRLPGAGAEPLFETRGSGGNDGTEVSPLVDIRSRLTNQSADELFVVQSNGESYWRSASLSSFDGQTWSLPDGPIDTGDSELLAARTNTQEIRQRVRVVDLTGSLVPAAPDPIAASGPGSLQFDRGAATLETSDSDVARGDVFDIVSSAPRFDPAILAGATSLEPGDRIYLEVSDDFPGVARDLAVEVTAGTTSSYEAALALQNWFRTEFTYSLEVQPGHGSNAIEGFLRERVGYCEQFAGTFAAMMRSLGIPTRVSVGFTTGRALGGDSYSVAGRNAHAWPEVWFDGVGWVLFEPTPGRGAPGAENYTGIASQQDSSTAPDTGEPNTETDSAAAPTTSSPRAANDPRNPDAAAGPVAPTPTPTPQPESSSSAPLQLLALVVLAAVVLVIPAVVRRVRRTTSRREPSGQIAGYWERALVSLADVGVPVVASSTPTETARHASTAFPIIARPIRSLADVVTATTYRPEGAGGIDVQSAYGTSTLTDSAHWTRQIERAVTDSIGMSKRIRRYFTRWR